MRLAFLLRHDKNYQFDEHGWREISDLITHHGYTMDELKEIVATNNKQRFEFSEDMTRIRARQGHSVQVDVELEEMLPPDILYHGTGEQSLASIMEQGINKGNRLYVHLSKTSETAVNVGKRHGKPVVLVINAILSAVYQQVPQLSILNIIVTPYLMFFTNRATGLLYSDIA